MTVHVRDLLLDLLGVWDFDGQARQYPIKGKPGISYFAGVVGEKLVVDCLLYRDAEGIVVGILNHFPFNDAHCYVGEVFVVVREDLRRQGIGTALVREGIARYNIDLNNQTYTTPGAALANAVERSLSEEAHRG